jgi:hypothetical protein
MVLVGNFSARVWIKIDVLFNISSIHSSPGNNAWLVGIFS